MSVATKRFQVIALDSVDSTSEEARRLAMRGSEGDIIIVASRQTAGRGRDGRTWVSPPGNLYSSTLLRPDCSPAVAARIGFAASLATSEAVAEVLPEGSRVSCKWPNDVLVNGRKVSGILLESSAAGSETMEWLIVGIGVNVAHAPESPNAVYPATSLVAEGAVDVAAQSLLDRIAERLAAWLTVLTDAGFEPLRQAWLRRAYGLNAPLTARLATESIQGVFLDLDGDGALVLRTASGVRRIAAGDVFPVEAGAAD